MVDWRDCDGSGGDERRRYRHCNFVSSSSSTNTLQSQFEKNPNHVSNTGSHYKKLLMKLTLLKLNSRELLGFCEKNEEKRILGGQNFLFSR